VPTKDNPYPSSLQRKILIGFTLTFVAILLALGITHYAFKDVMDTVDELSVPSEKLAALNHVFQEITTLDQLQRADAIKNPKKPHRAFLNESQQLLDLIDSLSLMDWDSVQQKRITSMKDVFRRRDKAFFSYLRQKSEQTANVRLSRRIDTLSNIINDRKIEIDTNVVTTQRKTTTTYLPDTLEKKKDERGFFSKLFGGKKKQAQEPETTHIKVQEELSITVDTLAMTRQNQALEEVEKIMYDLESDQRTQNRKLLRQELEVIHANTLFVSELLSILHQVENEELIKMRSQNTHASDLMSESIGRIVILVLVLFLSTAFVVYLVWIDITKSNFYKEQLEKAKDHAEELTEVKQRFLANMSHEIRTPLQSIIGYAEHIKQQKEIDREAVQAIHSSSEHLLHIVNEVLDYSRIASGNLTFDKDDFSLTTIIHEVTSAMRIQAEKKQLSFVLEKDSDQDFTLRGDSFRLRQILYNLLGNAIKFTHKGYVKLHVKTIQNLNSVKCLFQISDSGIGIKAEDLSKIFNQFEQANTSIARQYGGTGLGLTIVKSLIEAQDGNLTISSEPGQGSTFTVELIFEKAPVARPTRKSNAPARIGTFTGKVVVVDDDAMILRLCGLILQKYNVQHVLYNEAAGLIQERPDESVTHYMMDIRMPTINGLELCTALKKANHHPAKYIALTAHVLPEEQEALIAHGFDQVLSKPFREEDLTHLLGIPTEQNHEDAAPALVTIDVNALRKMTFDDERLFQSVIHQFIVDTTSDLQKLDNALSSQDVASIRETVHKLTGRIGQMGARTISDKLHRIEKRINEGEALDALIHDVRNVEAQISMLVESIKLESVTD
jgi:signal transduction histidine kinase/DNA-binding response OmpR family regulator